MSGDLTAASFAINVLVKMTRSGKAAARLWQPPFVALDVVGRPRCEGSGRNPIFHQDIFLPREGCKNASYGLRVDIAYQRGFAGSNPRFLFRAIAATPLQIDRRGQLC